MPRPIRQIISGLVLLLLAAAGAGNAASGDQPGGTSPAAGKDIAGSADDPAAKLQERLDALADQPVSKVMVEQAELDLKAAQLQLESLRLEQEPARRRITSTAQRIQELQDSIAKASDAAQKQALAETLAQQQEQLLAAQQQLAELSGKTDLAQQRVVLAQRWLDALQEKYRQQQAEALEQDLEQLEKQSRKTIDRLNQKIADLNQQLGQLNDTSSEQADWLRAQIDDGETAIFLTRTRLKLATSRSALDHLRSLHKTVQGEDIEALRGDLEKITKLKEELTPLRDLLQRKVQLVTSQQQVLQQKRKVGEVSSSHASRLSQLLDNQEQQLKKQLRETEDLIGALAAQEKTWDETYHRLLSQGLTSRQPLPRDAASWQLMFSELGALPTTLSQVILDQTGSLAGRLRDNDEEQIWLSILAFFFWLGAALLFRRKTRHSQAALQAAQTYSQRVAWVTLLMLRRVSLPLGLLAGLLNAAWLLGAEPLLSQLAILLLGLPSGVRLLLDLAHGFLMSELVPATERQPMLYRALAGNAVVSALLGMLVALGHLALLSPGLTLLVDRLFMLSLLPVVYLAFRLRRLVLTRLREHGSSEYWLWVMRLISMLVPLAVLGIALPGFAGYINLAWLVAYYLVATLATITAWLVTRGLVRDLATQLGKTVAARKENASLWSHGVITPLHYLIRILLFVTMAWLLARIYGLGGQSTLGELLANWLSTPVITIGQQAIDLAHIIGSLALIVLSLLAGGWIRRLSYEWLYAGIADRGVRNSLGVFTQYAAVLIGFIIALNLLGIDLTSLAVFAGALGVGIGFGLQNIANNFISGLILLMERPVRAGDWVTVGNYEGEIARIGIRSATLVTWDNQEVIIPNADLISNAFTNWTRSDPIVRTVLVVGVSYAGDPHEAMKVLEEAVTMQPEVMLQPAPHIYLINFNDSSVDIRVQYYTDVTQSSRLAVKSKVMLAIWDALKEANIEIPFPQRDVHIREVPAAANPTGLATPAPQAG